MLRNVIYIVLLNVLIGCKNVSGDIEIYHSPYIDDMEKIILYYNSTKVYELELDSGKSDYGNIPVKLISLDYTHDENTLRIICNQVDTSIILSKSKKINLLCIHYNNHKLRLGNDVDGDFFPMD